MKKWRCTVCGEIVESDVRPDKCPLCKAPGEKFEEIIDFTGKTAFGIESNHITLTTSSF